jgi:hypothetical protein
MINEQAERLLPPPRPKVPEAPETASGARLRGERRRLNRVFFLGTLIACQAAWLGALAYLAFRLS